MKLPEGIRFTAEDFDDVLNGKLANGIEEYYGAKFVADRANAKLPALFEAWVKQKGKEMHWIGGITWQQRVKMDGDTDQAYLVEPL